MAADLSAKAASKGEALVEQAEKRLNSWGFFNKMAKIEDAAEMYAKAAAQFKLAKDWERCGHAFGRAAELCEQSDNKHEAVSHYIQAAKALKNVSPEQAVPMYNIATERLVENNKFSSAAKLYKEMGEMHEAALDKKSAMAAYKAAADCYFNDDTKTSGNNCLLKVGDFAAQEGDYMQAVQIYEQVATSSLDSQLVRWSVSDYLFRAGLCRLAIATTNTDGDIEEFKASLEKYVEMHPGFAKAREFTLLQNLVGPVEQGEIEAFEDALLEYHSVSPLDNWKQKILLDVKKSLDHDEEPDFT